MKQRIYLILLLIAITIGCMAQTVGEEMYVYRNDGQINGFLPNEISAIEFSEYDAEGNKYSEVVTQIIHTADSIYMIPLAEIDSISFITPKTIYQPGIINLADELMPYVISSNEQSIIFNSSTPSSLMPHVGDKLVSIEMNDKFPAGFAGEVVSVSGSTIECKNVGLEEIFETFSKVSSTYGYQEENPSGINRRAIDAFGNKDFKLGQYTWSRSSELSYHLSGSSNLALSGNSELSISITPAFHIVSTLIVNKKEGTYFSASITGDLNFEEKVSAYGGINWSKDFLDKEWVKQPIAPLLFFYVKPGLFIDASATVSLSATWTQRYTIGAAFDFSTKKQNIIKPTCGGRRVSSSFDIVGTLDGRFAAGAFLEIGISIASSNISNLAFRGELGAEVVGSSVLSKDDVNEAKDDTKVYERLNNSVIDINTFVSSKVQAECGSWGISQSWNESYNIMSRDLVPEFNDVSIERLNNPNTSAAAKIIVNGNCLFPVGVGMSVRNMDGNEVGSYFANTMYQNGYNSLAYTFKNLSLKEDLVLYPKVKLFGYEMLATPLAEMNSFPVLITNFEQTSSEDDKDGYQIDGKKYAYKYGCSVTIDLASDEEVDDWGYVCEDDNGKKNQISFHSGYNRTDTKDTTYYRNEKESTIMLYEYIKYKGDDKYYYNVPKSYKVSYQDVNYCPDDNHPHMIDLGLPSGTKWACCNVGANKPESFGGYYAWGETSTKSNYSSKNYSYSYIGADIAGSIHDAATVNWGDPWRMPNTKQSRELIAWTKQEWTILNFVKGLKFTGLNGNTIFLPAAGEKGSYSPNIGTYGRFWLSSPWDNGTDAHQMYFRTYSSSFKIYSDEDHDKSTGLSVRPVCKLDNNGE